MFKWKMRLCSLVGILAIATATIASGSVSLNTFGQPKEPANLKQMLKGKN